MGFNSAFKGLKNLGLMGEKIIKVAFSGGKFLKATELWNC